MFGVEHPRDQLLLLFENALAACVSSAVAIAISPAHRTKIAVFWVLFIFGIACYGNFVNSAIVLPPAIAYRNIFVITFGALLGCVAAKVWPRRGTR